jgi:hypothetical protein
MSTKTKINAVLLLIALVYSIALPAQGLKVSPRGATVDVTLSVTPATGYCPYTATATWSATGASVCQKSGAWSGGPVNASGSETLDITSTSATFTMTCSANTDYRDLSWTNPTQNTDNSAVQLTSNKVFHGPSSANIETTSPIVISPAATSFRVSGLPSGVRYFGVKAVGQGGVESTMSNLVSVTVSLPAGAKTVTVGCTTPPPPKPPTGVTVASTVWEMIIKGSQANQSFSPGRDVGRIEVGRLCIGEKALIVQQSAEYWSVPRSEVTLYRVPKSTVLLGRCELREV